MSTIDELFAPKFLNGGPLTEEVQAEDGCGAWLRFVAVLACFINRKRNFTVRRSTLPGLYHGRLSNSAWSATV